MASVKNVNEKEAAEKNIMRGVRVHYAHTGVQYDGICVSGLNCLCIIIRQRLTQLIYINIYYME